VQVLGKSEELFVCRKVVELEGNDDKTKYIFMTHEHNVGHNHDIKISFSNIYTILVLVTKFKSYNIDRIIHFNIILSSHAL
jgi:hypothetical protein